MKTKLISAAMIAVMLVPATAATAQNRELRRDRQEIRQQERQLEQARRTGDRGDVREQREDVRDARREYREDWREHRRDHRQLYRAGRFEAPFRYRTFGIGSRLDRGYWAPRYRVSNVNQWRLPYAARNQAYVRHYNDLLLVNTRSGVVARVYRNFYW